MQCAVGLFDDRCEGDHFAHMGIGIGILLELGRELVELREAYRIIPAVLFACIDDRFYGDSTVHIGIDLLCRETDIVVGLEPIERIVRELQLRSGKERCEHQQSTYCYDLLVVTYRDHRECCHHPVQSARLFFGLGLERRE